MTVANTLVFIGFGPFASHIPWEGASGRLFPSCLVNYYIGAQREEVSEHFCRKFDPFPQTGRFVADWRGRWGSGGPKTKNRNRGCGFSEPHMRRLYQVSALTSFEPTLGLVDHVNATFTTHNPAITVPVLQRTERVLDLHGLSPCLRREPAPGLAGRSGGLLRNCEIMVGGTRIELVTPSMSTKCSTAELTAHDANSKRLCYPEGRIASRR